MKYPISPEYLQAAGEYLTPLYQWLEDYIIEKICEQFQTGTANATALELIRELQRRGLAMGEIEKRIKKTLKISQRQLDAIFNDAIQRNQAYYGDMFDKANFLRADAELEAMQREAAAIARQTAGDFLNLTQSMGFSVRNLDGTISFQPMAQAYQTILDRAAVRVMSSADSYDVAIRQAVKDLTDSGLQVVEYASGHRDRVDVAARRAIMTGISQLSAKNTEMAAEDLDTPYREVSAHRGARDTGDGWQDHKSWQGRVYSVRAGDKYPSIYAVCGLGYVDGLCGANCRHHYFPFLDGIMEPTYTDEELANIDPPPFEFEGKKYTYYEATQFQRKMERAIRSCKRRVIGNKAAGQNYAPDAAKLRRLEDEYKKFSDKSGLQPQKDRAKIPEFTLKDARESAKAAISVNKNAAKPPVITNTPKKPDNPSYGYKDATKEWEASATPNSHEIQDVHKFTQDGVTYKVDGKDVKLDYDAHEREIAELLKAKYGGDIRMMPRVSGGTSGVKTPDYLYRGERLDLKTLKSATSRNAVYDRIKPSQKQADNFILDATNSALGVKEIARQAKEAFYNPHLRGVKRIFVVNDGDIVFVFERK